MNPFTLAKTMRVLVFGGRDYADYELLKAELDNLHSEKKIACIIQGGASGADALAKRWAAENGIECAEYPADCKKYGKKAGPIRNRQMIDHGQPTYAVAFPGGKGTADMA